MHGMQVMESYDMLYGRPPLALQKKDAHCHAMHLGHGHLDRVLQDDWLPHASSGDRTACDQHAAPSLDALTPEGLPQEGALPVSFMP